MSYGEHRLREADGLTEQHSGRAFDRATIAELRTVLVIARRCLRTYDTMVVRPTDQNVLRFKTNMEALRAAALGGQP